ncbi:hypothetical protein BEP19_13465 [Ammoniphilus oxalaticus]|uniref:Uncharacterized protein n=1 Tax=Ammoniphilus oxalaticus TaxID=66863 RepID=A0A419SF29_9BACL|nr:hypothetical protein BEP19_13465 [Ammoniphilus oxalaticus]
MGESTQALGTRRVHSIQNHRKVVFSLFLSIVAKDDLVEDLVWVPVRSPLGYGRPFRAYERLFHDIGGIFVI